MTPSTAETGAMVTGKLTSHFLANSSPTTGPSNTSFPGSTRVLGRSSEQSGPLSTGGIVAMVIVGGICLVGAVMYLHRAVKKAKDDNDRNIQPLRRGPVLVRRRPISVGEQTTGIGLDVNTATQEGKGESAELQIVVTNPEQSSSVTYTPNQGGLVKKLTSRSPFRYDNLTPERANAAEEFCKGRGQEMASNTRFTSPALSVTGYARPVEALLQDATAGEERYASMVFPDDRTDKTNLNESYIKSELPDPVYAKIMEL